MATKTIDLNRCSAQDLAEAGVARVSEDRARQLVEYRDANGPFGSWEEVRSVPGFSDEMIDSLQQAGATLGSAREEEE